MSKAANIYWDSSVSRRPAARRTSTARRRTPAQPAKRRSIPWWFSFVFVTVVFTMLSVSINLRAYSEVREETARHSRLSAQVQNLMDENLALQEEIHILKTDPHVIAREARRIGMYLQPEKVSMPMKSTIAE